LVDFGAALTPALSQRERELRPFSLWEKVRMRGNDSPLFIAA